ncbi:AMP-binding protein [Massilia sp. H-1]|nr:AMP-binding protein [Massilia sp. H-1]
MTGPRAWPRRSWRRPRPPSCSTPPARPATPKGVVVTHANLIANSAVIQQAMAIDARSAVLTALPLFHDMGLIGGLVQSMYAGCVGHFMSLYRIRAVPGTLAAAHRRLRHHHQRRPELHVRTRGARSGRGRPG